MSQTNQFILIADTMSRIKEPIRECVDALWEQCIREHLEEFWEEVMNREQASSMESAQEELTSYSPESEEENLAWEAGCIRGIEIAKNYIAQAFQK